MTDGDQHEADREADIAQPNTLELAPDVLSDLLARWPDLVSNEVVVLPTQTRDGRTYYDPEELDAVIAAKSAAERTEFLHAGENRRFLQENAAGWELQAAIAIAENLTADVVVAICAYLWHRIRTAKVHGLVDGPETAVPVKVTVARVKRDEATGDLSATAFQVEGSMPDVTAILDRYAGDLDAR
jgi:porphobilinogen deaminase